MKKLLLILLCLPMIFSCGDDKKDNKKERNGEKTYDDIRGYWHVTAPTDSKQSLIFHFSEDGFLCTDVGINYSCGKNREKEHCDDCHSDNNWKYIDNEKTKISMKHRGRQISAVIRKEDKDSYFLSGLGPGEMMLERTTFIEINESYEEKKRKKEEYLKKEKEEQQRIKEDEEEPYYYGVINDPEGYSNVTSRKSSSSEIVFKVYEGEEFEIIDESDDNWWMIEYNGKQGYLYRNKIDIFKNHN